MTHPNAIPIADVETISDYQLIPEIDRASFLEMAQHDARHDWLHGDRTWGASRLAGRARHYYEVLTGRVLGVRPEAEPELVES